jgi:hypothetical protein
MSPLQFVAAAPAQGAPERQFRLKLERSVPRRRAKSSASSAGASAARGSPRQTWASARYASSIGSYCSPVCPSRMISRAPLQCLDPVLQLAARDLRLAERAVRQRARERAAEAFGDLDRVTCLRQSVAGLADCPGQRRNPPCAQPMLSSTSPTAARSTPGSGPGAQNATSPRASRRRCQGVFRWSCGSRKASGRSRCWSARVLPFLRHAAR